ncbi:MAG: isoprenylcysteine carboxylmethyltransferase family protein [bacterium]
MFSLALLVCLMVDLFLGSRHARFKVETFSEFLARALGSNFFLFYLIYKAHAQIEGYLKSPWTYSWFTWVDWLLSLFTFSLFIGAYLARAPALSKAKGAREIIFPLFCAVLPFVVYESHRLALFPWMQPHPELVKLFTPFARFKGALKWIPRSLILSGDLFILWGIVYLRKSFSILVEARPWVKTGPYRFIRHPLYLGESLATLGLFGFSLSYFNAAVAFLFLVSQRIRASFEEMKMTRAFPDYAEYKKKTGAYLPKIF